MKKIYLFAAILVLSMSAFAADVKVIANNSITANSVSADELKNLFLETNNSLSDGSKAQPVLAKGGAAHQAFVKQYLDKSDSALQAYYRTLVFTGKGSMPKELASDAEIVAYVAKTKGAIGYVSADANVSGVKTLTVK